MKRSLTALTTGLLSSVLLYSCVSRDTAFAPLHNHATDQVSAQVNAQILAEDGHIWREKGLDRFEEGKKRNLSINAKGELTLLSGKSQPGEFTSAIRQAPEAFNSALVAWAGHVPPGTAIQVSVRFQRGNTWTEWFPVKRELNQILSGPTMGFQFKAILSSESDRVKPQLSGFSLNYASVPMKRLINAPPPAAAPLSYPAPPLITREGWNARPPAQSYSPLEPDSIVVHHTWRPNSSQYHGAATIRGIQQFHMADNKWIDIGYHYLIGPDGQIFEGRPENAMGAHTVPNTGKIGICVIGDYDPNQDYFTPESYAALLHLMTWVTAKNGIATNRFYGHRDFNPKTCPGETIYSRLPQIEAEVRRRLSLPVPVPTPVNPDPTPLPDPTPEPSAMPRFSFL